MRRFIFLIIPLILLVAILFAGFLIFKKSGGNDIEDDDINIISGINNEDNKNGEIFNISINNQQNNISSDPTKNDISKLSSLTLYPIAKYWLAEASNNVLLVNYNGTIERLDASNNNREIIESNGIRSVYEVNPSPDGRSAIINLAVFNSSKKEWINLPEGATAADWHPNDNDQVVYLRNDGLYLLNLKTNKSSLLLKINNVDFLVDWAFPDKIYLSEKQSSTYNNIVWVVDIKNKTIKKFLEGQSLSVKWGKFSSDDSLIWGLKTNDQSIINKTGEKLFALSSVLPQFVTINEKCLTVENGFYCAVPQNLDYSNLSLYDDYAKKSLYTNDDVYFVNIDSKTRTGGVKIILKGDDNNPIDAVDLSIQNRDLFFINRYDQRLYKLKME